MGIPRNDIYGVSVSWTDSGLKGTFERQADAPLAVRCLESSGTKNADSCGCFKQIHSGSYPIMD